MRACIIVSVSLAFGLMYSATATCQTAPLVRADTQTTSQGTYDTLDLTALGVIRGARGLQNVAAAELTNIEVTHFRTTNSMPIIHALNGPDPATGARAALLEDLYLNTGVSNPGIGTGLTAPPTATSAGLQFNFNQPVVNGPGADVVLFDVDNSSPDPFVVSPLDMGQPGRTTTTVAANTYTNFGTKVNWHHRGISPAPQSLSELENGAFTAKSSYSNWGLYGTAFDLSDLGYKPYESAAGLFIQSVNSTDMVDVLLIAGLPSAAPAATLSVPVAGGLQLWLDGSDVNGDGYLDVDQAAAPAVDGDTLSSWTDKSGQSNHAQQSTGTKEPTFVADGINGYSAVDFDGSDDAMQVADNLLSSGNDLTVIAVSQSDLASGGGSSLGRRVWTINRHQDSGDQNSTALAVGQQGTKIAFGYSDSGLHWVDTDETVSTSTAFLTEFVQDGTNPGGSLLMNVDGLNEFTRDPLNFNTSIASDSHFWVGSQGRGLERFWNGKMAEVLVYDRALSADELKQVGLYLERKWGLDTAYQPTAPAADFSQPNHPNSPSAGWTGDWSTATNGTVVIDGPRVENNGTPLGAGGNYLTTSFERTGSSRDGALYRQYDGLGTELDTSRPHRIEFDFRLDEFTEFTEADTDFVNIFGQGSAASVGGPSSAWLIRADGNWASSGPDGSNWGFFNGRENGDSTFGFDRFVDSGIALVEDCTYHFAISLFPDDNQWQAVLSDGTDIFSSPLMYFRNHAVDLDFIHFGVRMSQIGEVGTFSIDSLEMATIPEPCSLGLLALGLVALLPRRRRPG